MKDIYWKGKKQWVWVWFKQDRDKYNIVTHTLEKELCTKRGNII